MRDPFPWFQYATVDASGSYSTIAQTEDLAIRAAVAQAGAGWGWPRMVKMGWKVIPVTIRPGHNDQPAGGGRIIRDDSEA